MFLNFHFPCSVGSKEVTFILEWNTSMLNCKEGIMNRDIILETCLLTVFSEMESGNAKWVLDYFSYPQKEQTTIFGKYRWAGIANLLNAPWKWFWGYRFSRVVEIGTVKSSFLWKARSLNSYLVSTVRQWTINNPDNLNLLLCLNVFMAPFPPW